MRRLSMIVGTILVGAGSVIAGDRYEPGQIAERALAWGVIGLLAVGLVMFAVRSGLSRVLVLIAGS
ncbi:MAG: hypothetical protein GY773_21420, partial [Actinomycetia bacterium]|nr:hypothetical protein [Actinomycetes bacterium]